MGPSKVGGFFYFFESGLTHRVLSTVTCFGSTGNPQIPTTHRPTLGGMLSIREHPKTGTQSRPHY